MSVENLTDEQAWQIAETIRHELCCEGLAACMAVVNREGRPLVQIAMNYARPFTAEVALQKAQQSAVTGRRTRQLGERIEAGEMTPELLGFDSRTFVMWPGGVPIYTPDGVLIGGAGISNLESDQDEGICIIGVEAVGLISDRN